MPKAPKSLGQSRVHSLYGEIIEDKGKCVRSQGRPIRSAKKAKKQSQFNDQCSDNSVLNAKETARLMKLARAQREELNEGKFENLNGGHTSPIEDFSDVSDGSDQFEDTDFNLRDDNEQDYNEQDYKEQDFDWEDTIEIDPEDERLFENECRSDTFGGKSRNLADIIMAKIKEKESREDKSRERSDFPPKVVLVYSKVGNLLSHYKSGKIPKAFKIIPTLEQWEDILALTRPDKWTPQACAEATKIFVSNLSPEKAQRFLNIVIFEKIREDISEHKKLNYHYYLALKKGLYRPAAWFKGILFPLVTSDCTLKEARIIGSVLAKTSVPILHSAAAILRLSEIQPPTGSSSMFIRILLDKKYALPYRVLDALVVYFSNWRKLERPLAVLEHQALLIFVQRYRNDLTDEHKAILLDIVKVKGHHQIGPEIRREIENSVPRGTDIPILEMIDV